MPLQFTRIAKPQHSPSSPRVSWFRCAVHLPAAPHPTWDLGLGLAGTPLSQACVFPAADLCRAGLPAHLAGHSRRILPQQLRSCDGRYLWIGTLARLRDVWRGSAAVVYHRGYRPNCMGAWRGTWMARVPVSQASTAVRLPRRLSDLRIDLGSVALSGDPLDRL